MTEHIDPGYEALLFSACLLTNITVKGLVAARKSRSLMAFHKRLDHEFQFGHAVRLPGAPRLLERSAEFVVRRDCLYRQAAMRSRIQRASAGLKGGGGGSAS